LPPLEIEIRFKKLEDLGAHRVELEGPELSTRIAEAKQIDAVLDIVGNSVILDSLRILRRGGRACLAGWLGGLAPIADFNPLLQMPSGVYLTFFASFVFGTPGFLFPMFRFRTLRRKWSKASSRRNRHEYFASKIFGKRIA
jgi:NADPH:quinone reductase-like Zn-dependent oxidoreductase